MQLRTPGGWRVPTCEDHRPERLSWLPLPPPDAVEETLSVLSLICSSSTISGKRSFSTSCQPATTTAVFAIHPRTSNRQAIPPSPPHIHKMTLDLPSPQRQDSYLPIPAEYEEALQKAQAQFEEHNDPAKESEWEDAGEREDVKLFKKTNPENAYDVPIVKGVTLVENATPSQVLAVIQQPGMRKKWDPRFDAATQLERYDSQTYLFYTYLKSPSYFVWARDIVGVQRNKVSDSGDRITVIQTSVAADQYVDEAGSYSKSRTRATLEVSAWDLIQQGSDTKLEYVVKIHLNGSLPTSVVSMVATETPMCVGRVRDVYYTNGHLPYDAAQDKGDKSSSNTILVYSEYEDGDGTEATSGEKRWTIWYHATGEDSLKLKFDNQRLYPSLNVAVEGDAASDVTADVDQEAGIVSVKVAEAAKGKGFSLVFTP
ncbi:bet v1-like protein [Moesziomyces antarcticus]|nr:bet v1-like protein [Moesziomyces antarcticus]GAK63649.1 bet v1-like protein [Moesziomyces antarcticus]